MGDPQSMIMALETAGGLKPGKLAVLGLLLGSEADNTAWKGYHVVRLPRPSSYRVQHNCA